ncbi:MAG: hypothetical protein H8D23_08920 [Candidatus Brocadiales bacterium]|nr:hypothetical protein [Candidatus Brocadiales bacterium]
MATYAEALLKKDVTTERLSEERELQRAERAREKQSRSQKIWGTIGSIVGLAFGPAGSFVGKQIGKYGADFFNDAETKKVSEGKFLASQSKEINKQLSQYDKTENISNLVGTGTDLLTTFAMGGGFEAIKGGESVAGAVSNPDYWTKFGGDTPNMYQFFKGADKGATVGDYFSFLKQGSSELNPVQMDAVEVIGSKS